MDVDAIRQAARIVTDEHGEPAVLLPLSVWKELLDQFNMQSPQHEQIKAILKRWADEPDDLPAEWWDEFDADLKASRTTFPEAL